MGILLARDQRFAITTTLDVANLQILLPNHEIHTKLLIYALLSLDKSCEKCGLESRSNGFCLSSLWTAPIGHS